MTKNSQNKKAAKETKVIPDKQPKSSINNKKPNQTPTIPKELETILGAINWLTLNSPSHRHLFISDMEWSIIPPVMLKQFRLFQDDNKRTIAYTSWAKISEEVEARILKTGNAKLSPKDWNSGNKTYLIDALTPFGGNKGIIQKLYDTKFKGQEEIKIFRPKKDGRGLESIDLQDLLINKAPT